MSNSKLISKYEKLSDPKLLTQSMDVQNALTNNPFFPDPPTFDDFVAKRTAYVAALEKTVTGDRYLIAVKNQAREALLAAMNRLALYIESIANGDRAKLLTTAFTLVATRETSPPLGVPTNFTIKEGLNPGELIMSCKAVPYAASYLFDISTEPPTENSNYETHASSSRILTLKNLKSGTRYYGRIRAIGSRAQETFSEVLSRIAQ